MLIESIPHNKTSSQSPSIKLYPVQKLPSSGFVKVDLKEAWVEFIKRYEPFTWFVTLTFKEPKHPEYADKAFFRWIRHINECLYGRRYREKKKGVTWIKCMEYQELRRINEKKDVIHFHSLVGDPNLYKLKRLDFMKAWEYNCNPSKAWQYDCNPNIELVNGISRIFKYDANRGAVNYCSKYVLKGGEIDLYI